jgi:hypothetical protein
MRFSTSGFFMNKCPPGHQVFHWGRFEFFQKFSEIFMNEYLSPVSLTLFSGVNDTGKKFIFVMEITKKPEIFPRYKRHH